MRDTFFTAPSTNVQLTPALLQLKEMLRYKRPHGSPTEQQFIDTFLVPAGAVADPFGNYYVLVGAQEDSNILWSSHVDTVHRSDGMQRVVYDQIYGTFRLPYKSASNCLGADCTTGVWLMLQMIEAKVNGLYVFHRGEECGGLGARWIADNMGDLLDHYDIAIAFDRYGTDSVVTHQGLGRSCSNDFADALCKKLNFGHTPDCTGVYTDTAEYTSDIPECTNISVGYGGHHTPNEVQNLQYVAHLAKVMTTTDFSDLPVVRDPDAEDDLFTSYQWGNVTQLYTDGYDRDQQEMIQLVSDYPVAVVDILTAYGLTSDDLCAEIYNQTGQYKRSF